MLNIINTIIFIVIVYLIKDTYKKNKKKHVNSPNGPIALPILGNIVQLKFAELLFKKQEHSFVNEYDSHYNGIVRFWLGDRYFLFISNYEIIKIIQKDDNFLERPSLLVPGWRYVSLNGIGVMGSSKETWSKAKSSIIKSFKKYALKELYEEKSLELMGLLKEKYENKEEIFYPKNLIYGYAASILFKFMFNQDLSIDNPLGPNVGNAVLHVFSNISKLSAFDCFEILSPLYDWFFERRLRGCNIVRSIISNQNNNHLESIDPKNPRDLMDELLIEYGLNEITEIEKTQINQTCFDIFGPSIGTVTITLCWVILQLCNRQELQEIAYKEIKDAVVLQGCSSVKMSHKSSTPYIIAFIKETMRLCSNGFGLPKTATNDQMCGDYLIPKDSIIFVNYLQISQNEQLFPNPTLFNPNRYLEDDSIPNLHFGVGQRSCPGRFIAIDEMYLCISNILLNYKIVSSDGNKIDDSIQFSVSLRCKDFGILLENRNN